MLSFFLLLIVYGTNSLSLAPLEEAISTAATDSGSLLSELKSDPKKFVSEVSNLNPNDIKHIVNLLEALLEESEDRETELDTDLSNKNTALADADTAVTDAKKVLAAEELEVAAAKADVQAKETAHGERLTEKETSQQNHDDEVPGLNDEQKVLRDVIDLLMGLHDKHSEAACSGDSFFAWSIENKVAACQGSFTGHPKDAALCASGWHTCNGDDVHNRFSITHTQSSSFSGCFAYDSMNDCHGCWMHCEDGASPVKSGGCLDSGHGHDLAAMGSGCSIYGSSGACIVDTRSNIAGYGRQGCNVQTVPAEGGVMCCID